MLLLMLVTDHPYIYIFFFFNDTATTEIYTLSLHDALPISLMMLKNGPTSPVIGSIPGQPVGSSSMLGRSWDVMRSEEHTSELQSRLHLVCRLLLEKKKKEMLVPCLLITS